MLYINKWFKLYNFGHKIKVDAYCPNGHHNDKAALLLESISSCYECIHMSDFSCFIIL